jgi:hypothetical protein
MLLLVFQFIPNLSSVFFSHFVEAFYQTTLIASSKELAYTYEMESPIIDKSVRTTAPCFLRYFLRHSFNPFIFIVFVPVFSTVLISCCSGLSCILLLEYYYSLLSIPSACFVGFNKFEIVYIRP